MKKLLLKPIQFFIKNKNLFIFILCVALAVLNLNLKLNVTATWFDGTLVRNHKLLLDYNYTNNEQSRLLQFYIPELFVKIFNLSIEHAYMLQRLLFTMFTFFCFYLFSKKWLDTKLSLLCVLIMALLVMPNTYQNHLQESAALLSLTFLGALWAIRENKTFFYVFILTIGSINNETMLFIPAVYFLVNFKKFKISDIMRVAKRTILLALPAIISVGIIRYINIDRPQLGGAWHFHENIYHLDSLLKVFNIFWILPFLYFKKRPLFLQRALISIPLFIIPHLITGIISETRQMIPLSFILIPASVLFLRDLYFKIFRIKTAEH